MFSSFGGFEDICEAFLCESAIVSSCIFLPFSSSLALWLQASASLLLAEWMSHSSALVCTLFCCCSTYRAGQGSEALPGRRVGVGGRTEKMLSVSTEREGAPTPFTGERGERENENEPHLVIG